MPPGPGSGEGSKLRARRGFVPLAPAATEILAPGDRVKRPNVGGSLPLRSAAANQNAKATAALRTLGIQ